MLLLKSRSRRVGGKLIRKAQTTFGCSTARPPAPAPPAAPNTASLAWGAIPAELLGPLATSSAREALGRSPASVPATCDPCPFSSRVLTNAR